MGLSSYHIISAVSYDMSNCQRTFRFYNEKQVPCMPKSDSSHLVDYVLESSFCSQWTQSLCTSYYWNVQPLTEVLLVAFGVQVANNAYVTFY